MSAVSESLSQLEVLVVDVQATAVAPDGHLLEMGWARSGATTTDAQVRLIALPTGERIPPAVARLTGISERMARDGVDAHVAWRELSSEAATLARQPAPTVIHFARFEQPFLRALAHGTSPLDIVCTHDVARRLLPDLPRRRVRALTGYFGRGVPSPSLPRLCLRKMKLRSARANASVACRFHDLRHTTVTRLVERGVPSAVVASVMDSSAATSVGMAKRYGHIGASAQQR